MKNKFLLSLVLPVVFYFQAPAQQNDFSQKKYLKNKNKEKTPGRFFATVGGQLQETFGGNFKVLTPPFSYTPDVPSLRKKATLHFQYGAALGYGITKNVSVSAGANISTLGQNYKDYRGSENDSMTGNQNVLYTYAKATKLTYLGIPIKIVYNTSEDKEWGFTGYVGICYSRLIRYMDSYYFSASGTYGSYNQTDTARGNTVRYYLKVAFPWQYGSANDLCQFSSRPFKETDIGEIIGIGWQGKLNDKTWLVVMLNYQGGFVDIKNADATFSYNGTPYKYYNFFGKYDPNQFVTYKNSLIGLSIGLKVKL